MSNELTKPILNLYSTFLGHFNFFRKLIQILLTMSECEEKLSTRLDEIQESIDDARRVLSDLETRISALASKPTDTATNFTRSSPTEIMERQWNAINGDSNE